MKALETESTFSLLKWIKKVREQRHFLIVKIKQNFEYQPWLKNPKRSGEVFSKDLRGKTSSDLGLTNQNIR